MTRTSKILAACLLASLCANAALAGFLFGKGDLLRDHAPPGVVSLSELFRRTPPDVRERLREAFREARQDTRADWQAAGAARARIAALLRQEPLDPAALRQAFADAREATGQVQDVFQEAVVEVLQGLTPEQRRRLGEAWSDRSHGRGEN